MVRRAKRGNVIYTPDMDKAIIAAWPQLATFEGVYPYEIKARARAIGLRLSPAESKRRCRANFKKWMSEFEINPTRTNRSEVPHKPGHQRDSHHQSMLFTLAQDRMILDAWPDVKNVDIPNRTYMQIYSRARILIKRKNRA